VLRRSHSTLRCCISERKRRLPGSFSCTRNRHHNRRSRIANCDRRPCQCHLDTDPHPSGKYTGPRTDLNNNTSRGKQKQTQKQTQDERRESTTSLRAASASTHVVSLRSTVHVTETVSDGGGIHRLAAAARRLGPLLPNSIKRLFHRLRRRHAQI
jgi:hypothetical protein